MGSLSQRADEEPDGCEGDCYENGNLNERWEFFLLLFDGSNEE
jgi:hypothetical protein